MNIILVPVDDVDADPVVLQTPNNPRIEPEFLIGRAPDCNVRVAGDLVSRHHCGLVVDPQDGAVRVRDRRSRNGTFVNGQRVLGDCPLQDGDQLAVANVPFEIRFPPADSLWERAAARSLAARNGPRRQFAGSPSGSEEPKSSGCEIPSRLYSS